MLLRSPIAVVSAGLVCSLGLSARAACAAVRARLESFEETLFFDDAGFPIVGAAIPPGALDLEGDDDTSVALPEARLAHMLAMAVLDCVTSGVGPPGLPSSAQPVTKVDPPRAALWVVAPEEGRYALGPAGLDRCFQECAAALGGGSFAQVGAERIGSPGLVEALAKAGDLLASPDIDVVLVAGVDSLLDAGDIAEALGRDRVLTHGVRDGFVPGEAAACVLVTRAPPPPAPGEPRRSPALTVRGLGSARETQTLDAELPSRGEGLARAIREALDQAGVAAHEVSARLADVSAESYFFEEASYAWSRLLRAPSPPGYQLVAPVTRVGHVGAAMGVLLLVLALDSLRRGLSAGPLSLVHLSGSGPPRGAVVVAAS